MERPSLDCHQPAKELRPYSRQTRSMNIKKKDLRSQRLGERPRWRRKEKDARREGQSAMTWSAALDQQFSSAPGLQSISSTSEWPGAISSEQSSGDEDVCEARLEEVLGRVLQVTQDRSVGKVLNAESSKKRHEDAAVSSSQVLKRSEGVHGNQKSYSRGASRILNKELPGTALLLHRQGQSKWPLEEGESGRKEIESVQQRSRALLPLPCMLAKPLTSEGKASSGKGIKGKGTNQTVNKSTATEHLPIAVPVAQRTASQNETLRLVFGKRGSNKRGTDNSERPPTKKMENAKPITVVSQSNASKNINLAGFKAEDSYHDVDERTARVVKGDRHSVNRRKTRLSEEVRGLQPSGNAVDLLMAEQTTNISWPQKDYYNGILELQQSGSPEAPLLPQKGPNKDEAMRSSFPTREHSSYDMQHLSRTLSRKPSELTLSSMVELTPARGLRPRFGLLQTDPDFSSTGMDKRLSESFRHAIAQYIEDLLSQYRGKLSHEMLFDLGRQHAYVCFERLANETPQGSKRAVMAKGASPDIVFGLEEKLLAQIKGKTTPRLTKSVSSAGLPSPATNSTWIRPVEKKTCKHCASNITLGSYSKGGRTGCRLCGLGDQSLSNEVDKDAATSTQPNSNYRTIPKKKTRFHSHIPSQRPSNIQSSYQPSPYLSSSLSKSEESSPDEDPQKLNSSNAHVSTRGQISKARGPYNLALARLSKETLTQKGSPVDTSLRTRGKGNSTSHAMSYTTNHNPGKISNDTVKPQLRSLWAASSETEGCVNLTKENEAFPDLNQKTRARSKAALLRHRELGHTSVQALRQAVTEEMACWRSWTGASKDVLTAIWAPDGSRYAVGSSADMDTLNLQYNRRNNLLLGNLERNTLTELDGHHLDRPRPETITSGSNSLEDTYNTVDPRLFATVTSLCFDHESKRLFSGSYDKTVKIWDVSNPKSECQTLKHASRVQLLGLTRSSELLATAQDAAVGSISLYSCTRDCDTILRTQFSSERAQSLRLSPTALQWGPSIAENLLVAGFGEDRGSSQHKDREGEISLWDVTHGAKIKISPFAQMIFDVDWASQSPTLAAGLAPGIQANLTYKSSRSVVRVWEPLRMTFQIKECECPAADINEIQFNPLNLFYISASCTDGSTYLWDLRREDKVLHRFVHEAPIDPIDPDLTHEIGYRRAREEVDTGVRFSAWDEDGRYLYTGASDGIIKCWDPYAAVEDALVRDVARFDSGIMSGSFSPDYSNIILGLSKGAVQILSSAPSTSADGDDDGEILSPNEDFSLKPYENITYIPADEQDKSKSFGVEPAQELITSGQIVVHPIWGAGQGPAYRGPYAGWARDGVDPSLYPTTDLDPHVRATQIAPGESLREKLSGGIPFKRPVVGASTEMYAQELQNDRVQRAQLKRRAHEMSNDTSDTSTKGNSMLLTNQRKQVRKTVSLDSPAGSWAEPENPKTMALKYQVSQSQRPLKPNATRVSAENEMRRELQRRLFANPQDSALQNTTMQPNPSCIPATTVDRAPIVSPSVGFRRVAPKNELPSAAEEIQLSPAVRSGKYGYPLGGGAVKGLPASTVWSTPQRPQLVFPQTFNPSLIVKTTPAASIEHRRRAVQNTAAEAATRGELIVLDLTDE